MVVEDLVGDVADLPGGDQILHRGVEHEESVQGGHAGCLASGSLAIRREDVQGLELALAGQPEGARRNFHQAAGHQAVQEGSDLLG